MVVNTERGKPPASCLCSDRFKGLEKAAVFFLFPATYFDPKVLNFPLDFPCSVAEVLSESAIGLMQTFIHLIEGK
jgi:hypothetical protein